MAALSAMAEKVRDVLYVGIPPDTWDNTPEPDDVTWGPSLASDPARRRKYREQLEYWLENPYELSERWARRAKRELNEQPDRMHHDVGELRKLVQAQPGLASRTDDHFLLSFLRSKRHELKPAFSSLLKYYRMRALNPKYFDLCLPSQHLDMYKLKAISILEGCDVLGRPICYFSADFSPSAITNYIFIQMIVHALEFLIIDPRVQVSGMTILVNLEKQSVAHARLITIKFLKLMLQIFQGSFPVRMKKIIVCHGSFLFRTTYSILKPFIPENFKDRIVILSSDVSRLPNFIPLDVLPPELHGLATTVREDILSERIGLIEDKFIEWKNFTCRDVSLLPKRNSMDFSSEGEPPIQIDDRTLQKRLTEPFLEQRESSAPDPTPPTKQSQRKRSVKPTQTKQSVKPKQPTQSTQPIPLTQQTQSIESTQTIQPTQTTQPVLPNHTHSNKPTQTKQSVKQTQPIQPTHPISLTQQTQSNQPTQTIQPTQTTQPILPGLAHSKKTIKQSVKPKQPTQPTQPIPLTQQTQSIEPTQTIQPTQTTQPILPGLAHSKKTIKQSVKPKQPTQSTQPIPLTHPIIEPIQTTQPTQTIQSTLPGRLIQPIQPIVPAQPIQPIQPIVTAHPIQPIQPIVSAQPIQPITLILPTQTIESSQPIQPAQLIQMAQPTQLIQLVDGTLSTQPMDSTQSVQSTESTERIQLTPFNLSIEPTQPSHAIQVIRLIQPIILTQPTEPIQPVQLIQPTQLAEPIQLTQPIQMPQAFQHVEPCEANQLSESTPLEETYQPSELSQLNQSEQSQPYRTKKKRSKCFHKRMQSNNRAQENRLT